MVNKLNPEARLPFGNDRAIHHNSGNDFLDSLRLFKRPIVDATFSGRKDQHAICTGLQIGEMNLTSSSTSRMHFKTEPEPQFTFVLPVSGWSTITEKNKVTTYGQPGEFVSISYSDRVEIDNEFTWIAIHPKLDHLFGETQQRQPEVDNVVERLSTSGVTLYNSKSHRHDYYQMLLKLIKIVDASAGDGTYLKQIGLDGLINGILARIVMEHGSYSHDVETALRTLEGVRAVDLICGYIEQNIGTPLTVARMKSMTGLPSGELNLAFQSRFQCSPIEWQRNFLLDHARSYLRSGREPVSVQVLARELGFISPRSFMQHYRKRFGTDWFNEPATKHELLETRIN